LDAKSVTRKLSAILSMDVQGYSRLMGDDEIATVNTITEYRKIVGSLVTEWKGRVVDSPGDNILAEFTSVVDAVQCAVEIQHVLKAKNNDLPENRRMIFRIGVNLGDVIQEGNRIYGDGVNIAARIESLADGGGISVSGTAYDHIKNKLALGYIYSGEHPVKNITEPVRVYKVPIGAEEREKKKTGVSGKNKIVVAALGLCLILFASFVAWYFYSNPSTPPSKSASTHKSEAVKTEKSKPIPEQRSIAVLPFDNFSEDKNQEYFSDGISEDLITDLSKISDIFVKSRKSSFAFKGKAIGAQEIAEKLGVHYILEGSVRRAGNRVRINAQLIDANTGHHLWAERYDENIDDIFDIQDKITEKIVSALAVKLTPSEKNYFAHKGTRNIAAYDAVLKGRANRNLGTAQGYLKAISLFREAIKLDPNYGEAYANLAAVYNQLGVMGIPEKQLGMSMKEIRLREREVLEAALKKNPTALTHAMNGVRLLFQYRPDEANAEAERALELDSSDPDVLWQASASIGATGRSAMQINLAKKALRLDPNCLF
jgi:adenylate cyclase